MYVNLARRSGGSPIRIVVRENAPGPPGEDWEDIVEVSVTVPPDVEQRWCSWSGMQDGALDIPPGAYRVRVSARGRDAGPSGEFADEPVDWYLLEFWPASRTRRNHSKYDRERGLLAPRAWRRSLRQQHAAGETAESARTSGASKLATRHGDGHEKPPVGGH